jgi:hypothetical protein
MTDQDQEKWLEKIRLLLNTNGCTEEEANSRIEKAHELLEKYNLDMSRVKIGDQREPELIDVKAEWKQSDQWLRSLYTVIGASNYCYTLGHSYEQTVSVIGRYVNVIATLEMVEWVKQQINNLTNLESTKYRAYLQEPYFHKNPESKSQYLDGFRTGLVESIRSHLKTTADQRPSDSKALVITLAKESFNFAHTLYTGITTGIGKQVRSSDGYNSGLNSGGKISLVRPSNHVGSGQLRLNRGQ